MTDPRPTKTPLTRTQARDAVRSAFLTLFGRAPENRELAILLAQSEHESGAWLAMWNYNWAGIKGAGDAGTVHLMTTEGHGASARRVREPFRAYSSAAAGCVDWLKMLARPRYAACLDAARAGDAHGFVDALRPDLFGRGKLGYFTGDIRTYRAIVADLAERWMRDLEGAPTAPAATPPSPTSPAKAPGVTVSIPGYRRAKQSEVTIAMEDAAIKALRELKLGEYRICDGYALACETHSNAAKGISIFLPEAS